MVIKQIRQEDLGKRRVGKKQEKGKYAYVTRLEIELQDPEKPREDPRVLDIYVRLDEELVGDPKFPDPQLLRSLVDETAMQAVRDTLRFFSKEKPW